jgi:hypothetical protein
MSPSEPLQLDARAHWSLYIFFVAIPGFLLISSLLKGDMTAQLIAGLFVAAGVLWTRSYRITFDGRILTYRTLVQRRSTRIDDISLARAEIGKAGSSDSKLQIILELARPAFEPPIVIKVKTFKKEDLDALSGIIKTRLADRAILSPLAKD